MNRMPAIFLALIVCLSSSAADVELRAVVIPEARMWAKWADFNGDGLDDLLYKNELRFNLGGRFGPATIVPEIGIDGAEVADLNGDGAADVILRAAQDSVPDRLILGDGSGHFTEVPLPASAHRVARADDFSGDGIPDLFVYAPGSLTLLRNNGDATFTFHQQLPWTPKSLEGYRIRVGDVNGDAIPDIVVPFDTRIWFYSGNPNGAFSEPRSRFTRTESWSVELGDVNADGRMDLSFINVFDSKVGAMLLAGDGTGRFPSAARYRIDPAPSNTVAPTDPVSSVIGDFIPGGSNELAYGARNGTVRLLTMVDGQLREAASVQLGAGIYETHAEVQRVSYRTPGGRDLVVQGFAYEGRVPRETVWLIEVDGVLTPEEPRSRTRSVGRVARERNIDGTYDVRTEGACRLPLSQLTLAREGMFVDALPDAVVRGADAVYIDGSLWMEVTIVDGAATRVLRGIFRPTAKGFEGTFFEPGPTPCGGSQRHTTTIEHRGE